SRFDRRALRCPERVQERLRAVEARDGVDGAPLGIEDVMDAVAGNRALELSAVAEVDRDARRGALALPMKDEVLAQIARDLGVRIKGGPEEAAVRAAELLVEVAE